MRCSTWKLWLCLPTLALAGGALPARGDAPPAAAQTADPTHTGIAWQPTVEAARARARREGKPVLVLHLFGRLDQEFC